jgi:hypothetical protein
MHYVSLKVTIYTLVERSVAPSVLILLQLNLRLKINSKMQSYLVLVYGKSNMISESRQYTSRHHGLQW